MGITKTLGGDRLGTGKKMQVDLKTYNRSTHNLSFDWKSSMSCGTLVPFMKIPVLNADTFDIDLGAMVKTKPTIAPLFGSFKMQLDVFTVPMRLYNGLLHNNATNIGLKMNQVLLPTLQLEKKEAETESFTGKSSLVKYLGISGIGTSVKGELQKRKFNGTPILMYYDIFKCYYSNKQETNAYVIGSSKGQKTPIITLLSFPTHVGQQEYDNILDFNNNYPSAIQNGPFTIRGTNLIGNYYEHQDGLLFNKEFFGADTGEAQGIYKWSLEGKAKITKYTDTEITGEFINTQGTPNSNSLSVQEVYVENINELIPFELENIDNMRYKILTTTGFNKAINIDGDSGLPYSMNTDIKLCQGTQNGLCVKTYLSDLFNNWLSTEFIEGLNGISQVTAVSTQGNSFTVDALNLAQKVYNMLNLIVAAGNTYEDWQEAKWGMDAVRRAESPIYEGGASYEIGFEEIVSTAETDTAQGGAQALGTLAGKGGIFNKKGGSVTVKVTEPSYIIGIASITPRICYSQGNDWDMTNLHSLDDLHSPELDGIGFQDLIQEQMAWWTTENTGTEEDPVWEQKAAGKQPAWINYMTNISKVYGDFADENKAGFMVLDRKYEQSGSEILDLTTYIDPTKYNYAFADTNIDAQNFWVQVAVNVEARRKMSAALIPTM